MLFILTIFAQKKKGNFNWYILIDKTLKVYFNVPTNSVQTDAVRRKLDVRHFHAAQEPKAQLLFFFFFVHRVNPCTPEPTVLHTGVHITRSDMEFSGLYKNWVLWLTVKQKSVSLFCWDFKLFQKLYPNANQITVWQQSNRAALTKTRCFFSVTTIDLSLSFRFFQYVGPQSSFYINFPLKQTVCWRQQISVFHLFEVKSGSSRCG